MNNLRVIDTNVLLVAEGIHPDVCQDCIDECVSRLAEITKTGIVVIDEEWLVLDEYNRKLSPNTGKKAGSVFLKWLLRNKGNPKHCQIVPLTSLKGAVDKFKEFPQHPNLKKFDPPDRKFVAVSNAHPGKPAILQAADSKWLDWSDALGECGIEVEFICKTEIKRFHRKKFGA